MITVAGKVLLILLICARHMQGYVNDGVHRELCSQYDIIAPARVIHILCDKTRKETVVLASLLGDLPVLKKKWKLRTDIMKVQIKDTAETKGEISSNDCIWVAGQVVENGTECTMSHIMMNFGDVFYIPGKVKELQQIPNYATEICEVHYYVGYVPKECYTKWVA